MPDRPPIQLLWADTHRHRALCMVHPLKGLGIHVRVVDDGWSALREFRTDAGGWDVAVLHCALSGLAPRELVRLLRRERPTLPLVLLGTPTWSLGPHERPLSLPLSPVALHDILTTVCDVTQPAANSRPQLRMAG